jgi:hypothetical protein
MDIVSLLCNLQIRVKLPFQIPALIPKTHNIRSPRFFFSLLFFISFFFIFPPSSFSSLHPLVLNINLKLQVREAVSEMLGKLKVLQLVHEPSWDTENVFYLNVFYLSPFPSFSVPFVSFYLIAFYLSPSSFVLFPPIVHQFHSNNP